MDLEERLNAGGDIDSFAAWEDFACPNTDRGAIGGRFSYGRREVQPEASKLRGEAFPVKRAAERSWLTYIKASLGLRQDASPVSDARSVRGEGTKGRWAWPWLALGAAQPTRCIVVSSPTPRCV